MIHNPLTVYKGTRALSFMVLTNNFAENMADLKKKCVYPSCAKNELDLEIGWAECKWERGHISFDTGWQACISVQGPLNAYFPVMHGANMDLWKSKPVGSLDLGTSMCAT